MRIEISRGIDAPHHLVWDVLADLASYSEWMRDAERIVFTSAGRRGVGTTMEVHTRIGPFRTVDLIEVVGWDEGRSIEVAHRGLITGAGRLSAIPRGEGSTLVTWQESLRFPWWLGGRLIAICARPVLRRAWQANLSRLERILTG